jgi:hypothetical protein
MLSRLAYGDLHELGFSMELPTLYISKDFAIKHHLPISLLDPLGDTNPCLLLSRFDSRNRPCKVFSRAQHPRLGAILGMDWLMQHTTQVDCAARGVDWRFQISFQGSFCKIEN